MIFNIIVRYGQYLYNLVQPLNNCIPRAIEYNLKSILLNNNKNNNKLQDYECQVCLETLSLDKEWYCCKNGHTACKNCWLRIMCSNNSSCMICKIPITSFNDGLSRCISIESSFREINVHCPYSYVGETIIRELKKPNSKLIRDISGCDKVIKIGELEDHVKNCQYRFIKCSNGCNEISRAYQDHQSVCLNAITECLHCKLKLKRSQLSNHIQNSCPSVYVPCKHCSIQIKRPEVAQHHSSVCPNVLVQCSFKEYGCNHQMKRVELPTHLEQVNHSSFMIKLIEKVNQNYYNQWIISNFLYQLKYKSRIYSPVFNVNEFQFRVICGYGNNEKVFFYLNPVNLNTFKDLSIQFIVKLLNSKDSNKRIQFTINQQFTKSWGSTFGDSVQFTKDSGYIFYDDSVRLDITINFKKPPLQS